MLKPKLYQSTVDKYYYPEKSLTSALTATLTILCVDHIPNVTGTCFEVWVYLCVHFVPKSFNLK